MSETFTASFTPSLMTPEALEAVFVQREELASRLVATIRRSATTAAKHYHLLVGPRGIGKTHLVSLVRHRVAADKKLARKLCIAWMREDEWGITSYLDLMRRIRDEVREASPRAESRAAEASPSYARAASETEVGVADEIEALLAGRTLLLIIENFDDILRALGEDGQAKLRAHLQNHATWTILATAQRLAPGIRDRAAPFYGFFEVEHLAELTFDGSMALLLALAKRWQDEALGANLQSLLGRVRLNALRQLAGGNPRVHVIFARFLARDELDDLVEPLMRTLDELTPYYQHRMAWLSPQQRKIVNVIADAWRPIAVKDIAQQCDATEQTTSSQLRQLRDFGYVIARDVGRESHYDLREPLLRYCLDLKKQRGPTIRLIVEFMVRWYTLPELQELQTSARDSRDDVETAHLSEAGNQLMTFDARFVGLVGEILRAGQAGEPRPEIFALYEAVYELNPYEWPAIGLLVALAGEILPNLVPFLPPSANPSVLRRRLQISLLAGVGRMDEAMEQASAIDSGGSLSSFAACVRAGGLIERAACDEAMQMLAHAHPDALACGVLGAAIRRAARSGSLASHSAQFARLVVDLLLRAGYDAAEAYWYWFSGFLVTLEDAGDVLEFAWLEECVQAAIERGVDVATARGAQVAKYITATPAVRAEMRPSPEVLALVRRARSRTSDPTNSSRDRSPARPRKR